MPADKVDIDLLSNEDASRFSRNLGHDTPFINALSAIRETSSGQAEIRYLDIPWKNFATDLREMEDANRVRLEKDVREFIAPLWRNFVTPGFHSCSESGGKGVYEGRLQDLSFTAESFLMMLAVLPRYQHSGASIALISWGIKAKMSTDFIQRSRSLSPSRYVFCVANVRAAADYRRHTHCAMVL